MRKFYVILAAAALVLLQTPCGAQKWEGLAGKPQMGWSSWNKFGVNISEQLLRDMADKMVELGLKDAGYIYLNIDDGWHGVRDSLGFIHEDAAKFPSGMRALADYVHSKGLKIGIYSDAGTMTCGCFEGSSGHQYQDAYMYAKWGMDYLKYDWCFTEGLTAKGQYKLMRDALRWAGRPIFFSMCEWGTDKPWEWAAEVGHSWRSTGDIGPYFAEDCVHPKDDGTTWTQLCVLSIIDLNEPLRQYAGPGHWNDPDMLEVGNGMSFEEDRTHFSMWCIMAAPLILGNDICNMTPQTAGIITNKECIAIDQDALGIQGFRIRREGDVEYWARPLEGGDWAVCIFNRGLENAEIALDWGSFKFTDTLAGRSFDAADGYKLLNVWDASEKVQPVRVKSIRKISLKSHDCVLYRLIKN